VKGLEKMGFDLALYDVGHADRIGGGSDEDAPYQVRDNKGGLDIPCHSIVEVLERVKGIGSKGITIQRYKGLGEMTPQQLWETTMDPKVRRLVRMDIEDVYETEKIFSTLMGEEVVPRRAFIQRHAPEVENLDV